MTARDRTGAPRPDLSPHPLHGPEVDWKRWRRLGESRKQVAITLPPDLVMWAKETFNLSRWVEQALRSAQEGGTTPARANESFESSAPVPDPYAEEP